MNPDAKNNDYDNGDNIFDFPPIFIFRNKVPSIHAISNTEDIIS